MNNDILEDGTVVPLTPTKWALAVIIKAVSGCPGQMSMAIKDPSLIVRWAEKLDRK